MILQCMNPECETQFEAFLVRKYCCEKCRKQMRVPTVRDNTHETPSNRRVEIGGGTVVVSSGRAHVISAQRVVGSGLMDNFDYLRAITCTGCGVTTIHNPYALPEYRSASGGWTEIDTERRTAVCPKCAETKQEATHGEH